MISQSEVESINRYLLEATGTLDNIQRTFIKKFESEPNPYPYFYQGLCDNIFTKGLRLLTIYLLYNSELKSCLQDIYNFTLNDFERKFIQDPQIYAGITMKTLLEEQDKFTSNDRPISKDYSQSQIAQNKMRNLNISLIFRKLRQNSNNDIIQQQNGFEIEYLRPIPNVVSNRFDWIDLNDMSYAIWDYSLQINSDKLSQIKEIIQKAHNEQISEYELQLFQEYLKKDNYNFLKNNGLINFNLGEIIEKNLNLAFFLFSKYFPNPEFLELMDNLVQIDVTPNGLEMMCMIVQQFHIPQEYLNYYINYCIQFCQNIKEKGQQVRMIKYFTIFLKHLINKKLYKTSDLVTELQAFSIEFSNIGETSSLFKLIKSDLSL
ncbi:unnamed protein product (macronuclear) [Paramecium tetraurelia]|uniref:CCR4-NOT transcription complex subunit 11 n=1 Tax=Paramecium tetraurelia TaxID=5888 RepID=A0C9S4_PARTE|nr:uncharacterized protein GSPATT00006848001 [Paramecium tetraurelia]CAK67541.1 unnamed protein product [Paramecium tetraurelia]|eukprot:XP_001434938.1 hypothetical protein (macronuclear) [Paramecium tetraurelia strain d4-2]